MRQKQKHREAKVLILSMMQEVIVCDKTFMLSETLAESEMQPIFSDGWTGSRVWTASIELATLLQNLHTNSATGWFQDVRTVIELGSGCGLAGLMAGTFPQVTEVVLTDQSDIVDLLRKNISLNSGVITASNNIKAVEFTWGDSTEKFITAPDLVLVSDCINPIYGCESWRLLAASVIELLGRNTSAKALVSYERRGTDEAWEDFTKCLGKQISFSLVKRSNDSRILIYILQNII